MEDNKFIDLHTHTTFSDGTFTPTQLVEYAAEKGLSAVAITDHDCTDGISEALCCGTKIGVEVIPGIEMSTDYLGTELHIVGLFIDNKNETLINTLATLKNKRATRNRDMVEKLNSIGISITYNDVLSEAKGNVITRAHFANALLKNGSVTSVKEAFDRYIGDGKKAYIKRELPSAETAIHLISEAGGIAVLAHPLLYKMGQKQLENTIKTLSENGLAAIEAYYTTHSPSNVKYIKLTAEKFRLKISGGSDFHGKNKPDIDLGTGYGSLKIPYTVLSDLKEVKKNG